MPPPDADAVRRHYAAGRLEAARDAGTEVAARAADDGDAIAGLAAAALEHGDLRWARTWADAAIAAGPERADPWIVLGVVQVADADAANAARCLDRARALDAGTAARVHTVGFTLLGRGRHRAALAWFDAALTLEPGAAESLNGKGEALRGLGLRTEARRCYEAAIDRRPGLAAAHSNLGVVHADEDRPADAEACYCRAIELDPELAAAWHNLGNLLFRRADISGAREAFERALRLTEYPNALVGLGNVHYASGDVDEAARWFRRALERRPGNFRAHTNLLLALGYRSELTGPESLAAHRGWGARHAPPGRAPVATRRRAASGDRLRIGYLSGDFSRHAAGYFIEPLLRCHDRDAVAVRCYSAVRSPDSKTRRLRGLADGWRDVAALSDREIAQAVAADAVDVLVDLSGHTSGNRLGVFGHGPAPVQASYLGYPFTTGVDAITHRVTDDVLTPAGACDGWFAETLVRLPRCFCAYGPPEEAPDVAPPPSLAGGAPTFGSLTTLAKMGPSVLDAWGRLLGSIPGARLVIQSWALANPAVRRRIAAELERRGVAGDRIDLLPSTPLREHLSVYGRIDVALDTFPWTAHTTTCHALWMGVPVVTVAPPGPTRMSASVLHTAGLESLVAGDEDEYVEIARGLASDPERLAGLRRSMRDRLRASPLLDGRGLALALEDAYRAMVGAAAG